MTRANISRPFEKETKFYIAKSVISTCSENSGHSEDEVMAKLFEVSVETLTRVWRSCKARISREMELKKSRIIEYPETSVKLKIYISTNQKRIMRNTDEIYKTRVKIKLFKEESIELSFKEFKESYLNTVVDQSILGK